MDKYMSKYWGPYWRFEVIVVAVWVISILVLCFTLTRINNG